MKRVENTANLRTVFHWGGYAPRVQDGRLIGLEPAPEDSDPSPLGRSYVEAVDDALRIRQPMIRESWLTNGPGSGTRGAEPFVAVEWGRALDLVAAELERVKTRMATGQSMPARMAGAVPARSISRKVSSSGF